MNKLKCLPDKLKINNIINTSDNSKSNSLLFLGTLDLTDFEFVRENSLFKLFKEGKQQKEINIAIKLYMKDNIDDEYYSDLEYEKEIYRKIISKLQVEHINFIKFIGACETTFNEFFIKYQLNKLDQYNLLLKLIRKKLQTKNFNKKIVILIIETSKNYYSLDNYLENNNFSKNKRLIMMNSIIKQIFFSLKYLEDIHLNHYDLHFNNILVFESKDYPGVIGDKYTYSIDNKEYKINLNGILLKIFDWNLGFSNEIDKKNDNLKDHHLCKKYGKCNLFTKNYDLYLFLVIFSEYFETLEEYDLLLYYLDLQLYEFLIFYSWWGSGVCTKYNNNKCIKKTTKLKIGDIYIYLKDYYYKQEINEILNNINHNTIIDEILNKLDFSILFQRFLMILTK